MRKVAAIGLFGMVAIIEIGGIGNAAVLATKDPCKLLKQSEMQKMLGLPFGPPAPGRPTALFTQCYWQTQPAGALPAAEVGTVVQTAEAKATYDTNRQAAGSKPVRGIKKAFFNTNLATLYVLRGDVLLSVQVLTYSTDSGNSDAPRYKEIVKLTKIALKRLK